MRRTTKWLQNPQPGKAKGLWSVVNIGMMWILFALTPFGIQIVHGRVPDAKRLVSEETPLATVAFLESMETMPRGIAFVPAEWAGYVMNRGPKSIEPMVNLHVHVIPEQVWNDYMRMINGPSDWNGLMDEYGINFAVVDKIRQPALMKRFRESTDWTTKYEDRQGIVFVRNNPI
jgi:diadenosine tetraphosphate (Ap4A) HIT family hydrolase